MTATLARLLRAVRRRVRGVWALDTIQVVGPLVGLAALVVVAAGWVFPLPWSEWVALGLAVTALVVILGAAIVVRLRDDTVARVADRGLHTKDAFSSALEHGEDPVFGERIRARADRLAADASPRDAVPVRWRRRSLAMLAVLVPVTLALTIVRSPQDEARAREALEQEALDALADDVEEAADELRADPAAADAAARLDELAGEIRRADDLAEAEELARLAADELARSQTADALAERAATEGLDRSLGNEPLPGADGQQTAAEQLGAAADALPSLSAEELAQLAERLEQLAATQEVGDPATADALQDAADELRAGNTAGAAAALGEAASANASANASSASTAANADAAATARAAADAAARGDGASQSEGDGAGDGSGQGEGSGSGGGSGSGRGQGDGNGSGQGGGGGGQAGDGGPSGDVGGATPSGNNPSGQGGQGSGTGSSGQTRTDTPETDTIFDPVQYGAGDQEVVGGGTGSGEGGTIGRTEGPTNAGTARVPVADVIDQYANTATEALDRAVVAPSDRNLVISYFDQLQGRD